MTLADRVVVVTGGARGIGRALIGGLPPREGQGCRHRSRLGRRRSVQEGDRREARRPHAVGRRARRREHRAGIHRDHQGLRDRRRAREQRGPSPAQHGPVDVRQHARTRHRQMATDDRRQCPRPVTRHPTVREADGRAAVSGSIINVGSITGDFGIPGMQPYTMSKSALKNWTLSLAQELKQFNIAVNVFSPGMSWTTGSGEAQEEQTKVLGKTEFPPGYRPESTVPLVLMLAATGRSPHRPMDTRRHRMESVARARRPRRLGAQAVGPSPPTGRCQPARNFSRWLAM